MDRVNKIFETIDNAHKELEAIFEELAEGEKEIKKSIEEACNAYKADVTSKKSKVKEQIKEYENQKDIAEKAIALLQPKLLKAITTSNEDEKVSIQTRIEELKAKEAALNTQIEMLSSAMITGDNELYRIAKELDDKMLEYGDTYDDVLVDAYTFANQQVDLWEKKSKKYDLNPYTVMGFNPRTHCKSYIDKIEEIHNNGVTVNQ